MAVDPHAVPRALLGDLGDRGRQLVGLVEADVPQRDVRPAPARARSAAGWRSPGSRRSSGRCGTGRRARCRARGDHLAGAGEDVHLQHRLVGQPVAERGRLDAQAGDRAAEGDRPQLRHDQRDQPVPQGRVDQVLVGAHPLDVGGAPGRVDGDDAVEPGDVESGAVVRGARTEEVRGPLASRTGVARRDRVVGRPQPVDRLLVPCPPVMPTTRNLSRCTRRHVECVSPIVPSGVPWCTGTPAPAKSRSGARSPSRKAPSASTTAASAPRAPLARPPSRCTPRARRPSTRAGRRPPRRTCARPGRAAPHPRPHRCAPASPGPAPPACCPRHPRRRSY